MSEKVSIGQLIEGEGYRDAIHVAIMPVVAGEQLLPGTRVSFADKDCKDVLSSADGIGIIDPFLEFAVGKGERCYMLLMPNTITSLRHQWTHPLIPNSSEPQTTDKVELAKEWLRVYASKVCPYWVEETGDREKAYENFVSRAASGEIFYYGTNCHGAWEVEDADELYENLSIVFGRHVSANDFEFSCSC